MDIKMQSRKPKRRLNRSRIKIWDLKGEQGEEYKRYVGINLRKNLVGRMEKYLE